MTAKESDLEIRVAVLERLLDRALDGLFAAKVAEKTADKALAMAQECLVIVTSAQNQQFPTDPLQESETSNPYPGLVDAPSPPVEERVSGILARRNRMLAKHEKLSGVKTGEVDIPEAPEVETLPGVEPVNDLVE